MASASLPVLRLTLPNRGLPALHLLVAAIPILLAPASLAAQVVRGVVLDDTNRVPVPGAMVRMVLEGGDGRGTETDEEGRFLLPVLHGPDFLLQVSRFGYQTAQSQFLSVESGDTLSVEFMVSPDAVLLDPITVLGRLRRGSHNLLRRFEEWDRGIFITPAMIDSLAPNHPAEILKGLDKVDVRWGWGMSSTGQPGPVPSVRTVLGRGCVHYMVNFDIVRGGWSGFQMGSLEGRDIVAVEVYRSVLEVPPELRRHVTQIQILNLRNIGARFAEGVHCGLVVFWTRWAW